MAHRQIRPIRIEGNDAYIMLTKGYEAVIDAASVPLVEAQYWCAQISGKRVYAVTTDHRTGRPVKTYLHRVVTRAPAGFDVDHIDGDGLNNREANLRQATRSENMRNTGRRKDNKSGFKGVYWHKGAGKWQAEIKVGGVKEYLGLFTTIEAAHAAHQQAAKRLHGEFWRGEDRRAA